MSRSGHPGTPGPDNAGPQCHVYSSRIGITLTARASMMHMHKLLYEDIHNGLEYIFDIIVVYMDTSEFV